MGSHNVNIRAELSEQLYYGSVLANTGGDYYVICGNNH